jgi:hypothetical protein
MPPDTAKGVFTLYLCTACAANKAEAFDIFEEIRKERYRPGPIPPPPPPKKRI